MTNALRYATGITPRARGTDQGSSVIYDLATPDHNLAASIVAKAVLDLRAGYQDPEFPPVWEFFVGDEADWWHRLADDLELSEVSGRASSAWHGE